MDSKCFNCLCHSATEPAQHRMWSPCPPPLPLPHHLLLLLLLLRVSSRLSPTCWLGKVEIGISSFSSSSPPLLCTFAASGGDRGIFQTRLEGEEEEDSWPSSWGKSSSVYISLSHDCWVPHKSTSASLAECSFAFLFEKMRGEKNQWRISRRLRQLEQVKLPFVPSPLFCSITHPKLKERRTKLRGFFFRREQQQRDPLKVEGPTGLLNLQT